MRNLGRKVGLGDLNAEGREGRKTWWGIAIDGVRVLASALVAKAFSDGFAVAPNVRLGLRYKRTCDYILISTNMAAFWVDG